MKQTGFPLSVRCTIIERAQGLCERCGEAKRGMQVHHRRPRGMGGSRREDTNRAANGLYLDAECHSYVESHRSVALSQGWLIPQSVEPWRVPVKWRGRWVRLCDDGSVVPVPQQQEDA